MSNEEIVHRAIDGRVARVEILGVGQSEVDEACRAVGLADQ